MSSVLALGAVAVLPVISGPSLLWASGVTGGALLPLRREGRVSARW